MKIYFLVYNIYGIGGTVRTTINTANYLADQGWDVAIVSVRRTSNEPSLGVSEKITLIPLFDARRGHVYSDMGLAKRSLKKLLVRSRSLLYHRDDDLYDNLTALTDVKLAQFLIGLRDCVLVTTTPSFNLLSSRLTHSSVTRVGQEHKVFETHPPKLQKAIQRSYGRLNAVTSITQAASDTYSAMLANDKTVVQYIPNGTPFPEYPNKGEHRTVISAGRLADKCFDRLIRIFAEVAKEYPDWKLKIFGDGDEYREVLQELVFKSEAQNHVFLMPKSNNLSKEYAKSNIYALSARTEAFGMVLIEAMAHGIPCVAFKSQGPCQLIEDGKTGFLVEPEDEVGFQDALKEMISSADRRHAMGLAARDSIAQYSMNSVGKIWEDFFTSLGVERDSRESGHE